jgi:hypothetical protein
MRTCASAGHAAIADVADDITFSPARSIRCPNRMRPHAMTTGQKRLAARPEELI